MPVPRIVLAATHSGAGKTTITTGLMAALTRKGIRVQPYKVGPDYIDPSYHTRATGTPGRNLDTWMLGEDKVMEIFDRTSRDADIAIVEGVMGLHDGASATEDKGSTAQVAKLIGAPVILVLDVKSMARSAAALVLGFQALDPELKIAGVILNRIGSDRHYRLVKEAIEKYTKVPIVGFIRKNSRLVMPERHLGLVPMAEKAGGAGVFDELADIVEEGLDFEMLMSLAGFDKAGAAQPKITTADPVKINDFIQDEPVTIAYALDEAFTFYYQDSLDLLKAAGAKLVPFSPLHDKELPRETAGIYIGGGFPELFLQELAGNTNMLASIRKAHALGTPIYAECGGLMYLCREIIDFENNAYKVAGLVPACCQMKNKLVAMGYTEGEALKDNLLCSRGTVIKGHEFHYSDLILDSEEFPWAFNFHKKTAGTIKPAGYAKDNLLASYLHVNLASDPQLAAAFVARCRGFLTAATVAGRAESFPS